MTESNCHTVNDQIICIVGPTASGKSDLAQELAIRINAEVVSADSMQVYRGMDIGTGKIPSNEMKVSHWGIDLVDPDETFSVSLFQKYARCAFEEISAKGKRSILCGGTGLYIRAAIDDFEFPKGEQLDNPVREQYTSLANNIGPQALWEMLLEKDPQSAKLIHPNNVRRVIRAFEMLEEGISYADQNRNLQTLEQKIPAVLFGLQVEPSLLNKKIDARVDVMFQKGLVDEVKSLLRQGLREAITAPQAIGYKEVVAFLEGESSLDEAKEAIKVATHRYAKRQRTWFRKDDRIQWIDADSGDVDHLVSEILDLLAIMKD